MAACMIPENHFPNCIIQSWPLEQEGFQLNENGLVTGIYSSARKTMDSFSNIKSNNYLPYAMAALHSKKQKWNDAFLLNTNGTICDSTIANVFIIKDDIILTPPAGRRLYRRYHEKVSADHLPATGYSLQRDFYFG